MLGLLTNTLTRASISKQFILAIFESVYLPKATQVSLRDSTFTFITSFTQQQQQPPPPISTSAQQPRASIASIVMAAFKARARVLREMRDDTDHSLASVRTIPILFLFLLLLPDDLTDVLADRVVNWFWSWHHQWRHYKCLSRRFTRN